MNKADLILFIGQSNMAGRGITSDKWPDEAVILPAGIAYEYRAVSAPETLTPLDNSFGRFENRKGGIHDIFGDGSNPKTGSLVPAFCRSYYDVMKTPIVGVSASKGGSAISEWQLESDTGYLKDAIQRYKSALHYLEAKGITVENRIAVFCQGETDGDRLTSKEDYISGFLNFWNVLSDICSELFMIQIGNCNIPGQYDKYRVIQSAQEYICENYEGIYMVSRRFYDMLSEGLMKDSYHYYQHGYNLCGLDAGKNTASILCDLRGGLV